MAAKRARSVLESLYHFFPTAKLYSLRFYNLIRKGESVDSNDLYPTDYTGWRNNLKKKLTLSTYIL